MPLVNHEEEPDRVPAQNARSVSPDGRGSGMRRRRYAPAAPAESSSDEEEEEEYTIEDTSANEVDNDGEESSDTEPEPEPDRDAWRIQVAGVNIVIHFNHGRFANALVTWAHVLLFLIGLLFPPADESKVSAAFALNFALHVYWSTGSRAGHYEGRRYPVLAVASGAIWGLAVLAHLSA